MSPRVGDLAQKNYPPPNYPGGGSLRVAPSVKDERVYAIATEACSKSGSDEPIMDEDFPH